MGGRRSTYGLKLVVFGMLLAIHAVDVQASVGEVRVALQNYDGVPTDVIKRAQTEVTRLFALIDVDIVWVPEPVADPKTVRFVKVTTWEPTDRRIPPTALGVTYGERATSKRAYILWLRVQRQAERNAVGLDTMLAIAIAHEIGHVLLPRKSHVSQGIMRETWDANDLRLAAAGMLGFSKESAVRIALGLRPQTAIADQNAK